MDFRCAIFLFSRFTVILYIGWREILYLLCRCLYMFAQHCVLTLILYTGWHKIVYLLRHFVQDSAKLCIYCDTSYRVAQNFILNVVLTRKYQPYCGWRLGILIPYTVGIRIYSSPLCGSVRRSLKGSAPNDFQLKLRKVMTVLALPFGSKPCRRRRRPRWNSWGVLKAGWEENWHCRMIGRFRLTLLNSLWTPMAALHRTNGAVAYS
jgi:hypothetical protein